MAHPRPPVEPAPHANNRPPWKAGIWFNGLCFALTVVTTRSSWTFYWAAGGQADAQVGHGANAASKISAPKIIGFSFFGWSLWRRPYSHLRGAPHRSTSIADYIGRAPMGNKWQSLGR